MNTPESKENPIRTESRYNNNNNNSDNGNVSAASEPLKGELGE